MLRKLLLIGLCAFSINNVQAICIIQPTSAPPQTLTLPPSIVRVDASAPADTANAIATFNTPTATVPVYFDCVLGDLTGKSVISLSGQDSATRIYKTDIPGIGIKLQWNNGSAFGQFPSSAPLTSFPGGTPTGFTRIPAGSYYRVEIFKTADRLQLLDPQGDVIIPAGITAYNWVNASSLANVSQQLNIGSLKIISTPSCTYDTNKTVDFGLVSARTLVSAGIERDLDIAITCRTDYGSYSATASISTDTPASDASYIKVTDADGNSDNMGIKIRNSNGDDMTVDGLSTQQISGVGSDVPAQFHWKAVLVPVSSTHPANGQFTARAEILLQLK